MLQDKRDSIERIEKGVSPPSYQSLFIPGEQSGVVVNETVDKATKRTSKIEKDVEFILPNKDLREKWDSKLDFLLSVIGFAVDLGNIWRFPYICYQNGGGAFLIPYLLMYIFGGLPLFYMELALGQFQRSGCITVWNRICPLFTGIGYGICIIASFTAWYYNTIISWALFYMFDAMRWKLPWDSCDNWWNTDRCITVHQKMFDVICSNATGSCNGTRLFNGTLEANGTAINSTGYFSSTEEYFYNRVLQIQYSDGFNHMGTVRWEVALCLLTIFTIVYFALWKGVKSSGKAVWVTATLPYVILSVLLIRGLTLPGSLMGIEYYLFPKFEELKSIEVWNAAASQIFFSLGPGFGVLLALASYNKFRNNCYRDAMITSAINCGTSFMSGFVVFSVLGHMCHRMGRTMDRVANEGPSLVFIAYPEAIATLSGSTFWAIIFMLMLITLGLDSTFGGLEAIITGILDRWPKLRGRRELLVLVMVVYCFLGALPTTTNGGYYILTLLDTYGAPFSILFIVFCECVALCWFYGVKRFSKDVESMLGFRPNIFWQICWAIVSPTFLLCIFILNILYHKAPEIVVMDRKVKIDSWVFGVAWCLVFSSLITIPLFAVITFCMAKGTVTQRFAALITPGIRPAFSDFHLHPDSTQHKATLELTSVNNGVEEVVADGLLEPSVEASV